MGALFLVACGVVGDVRPQRLVVVSTNLPVVVGNEAPLVATMDSVRVDVLEPGSESVRETRTFVVGDPAAWPLSFGVVGGARIRVRLFSARWARVGTTEDGERALLPRAEVTVDRLVDLDPSEDEVTETAITLDGDCLGIPADLAAGTTCIDARSPRAPARVLSFAGSPPPPLGSWSGLASLPCRTPADPDRPCIEGGFDVVGDPAIVGLSSPEEDPLPLRPVLVSPFRMDRLEYTVGRYRALALDGRAPARAPSRTAPGKPELDRCTYLGLDDARNDEKPLNCVHADLARALCEIDGGRLPTEAEWEHAASGRGEGRPFPWGFSDPSCCTVGLSRAGSRAPTSACGSAGLENAGSHVGVDCPGGGDVSRDGLLDLGGSLFELTADTFASVARCTSVGIARDPRCTVGVTHVVKSADFSAGLLRARVAFRIGGTSEPASTQGFRCAYAEPR